ncbi:MAG TPA: PrsW family glutamic-type intramembrane protease [Candidatus Paceibacterota bacterium]|nr:PrsW family glutamic-type intramembrane protease [Candidatus Paceibacterota bacterium]
MADINNTGTLLAYAALGGILPALLWLWFWLQEDKLHPEPRSRIMLAFLGGMVAVALVYFPEKAISAYTNNQNVVLFVWALLEEAAKLFMAWLFALRTRDYDEPIDALEYLITVALGFAALENTLFILNPLLDGNALQGLVVGNMRFVGASLLHVVSSAMLGYCIAREFYRSRLAKNIWRTIGLSLAVALHTIFNLFIIYDNGSKTFFVFGCLWAAALGVLLLFEKTKKVIS